MSKKQDAINRKYAQVCKEIDAEREPVCSGCGRGDRPLSHAHSISRSRCHALGKDELIYDKNNIEIMCFGSSDTCHEIFDNAPIEQKALLLNL